MKKLFTFILLLVSTGMIAQTIVSTTPANKNVVLEEFTGIHCGYCPDGHLKAQQLKAAHPEDVSLINIHVGSYATPGTGEPDFRTSFGDAIANSSSLTGYPAGQVNRHIFTAYAQNTSSPGTAMSRGNWANAASQIFAMPAYLNVGVEANVNHTTRVLTVHVEVFYTDSSPVASNRINIALTQDSVHGPQSGASSYNPGMIIHGVYHHMHMLRHLITGQWGEVISTTTQGTFYEKTYTYTIPATINSVEVDLNNLHVVAFVTQTQKEVINSAEAKVINSLYIGENEININSLENNIYPNPVAEELTIENSGSNSMQQFEIMNVTGQIVYSSEFIGKTTVNTSNFANGIYVIRFIENNEVSYKKFVKE